MRIRAAIAALIGGVLALAIAQLCLRSPLEAAPVWGSACRPCHPVELPGAVEAFDTDGVLDPDESATGAPDRGALPVYRVAAGGTIAIEPLVFGLSEGDRYAVQVRRLRHPGVVAGADLAFTEDCTWASWTESRRAFTMPDVAFTWPEAVNPVAFNVTVAPDTPEDVWDLLLAVAGRRASDGALFADEVHVYLQVTGGPLFADGFESGDTSQWSDREGGAS